MARALELARRAKGRTSLNPAVAAVLVRDGRVVGEGATQPEGRPHAETVALDAAGPLARGAVLHVTLEPCAHQGRTPPCADAVVAAGVAEVHVATLDGLSDTHGLDQLKFMAPDEGLKTVPVLAVTTKAWAHPNPRRWPHRHPRPARYVVDLLRPAAILCPRGRSGER